MFGLLEGCPVSFARPILFHAFDGLLAPHRRVARHDTTAYRVSAPLSVFAKLCTKASKPSPRRTRNHMSEVSASSVGRFPLSQHAIETRVPLPIFPNRHICLSACGRRTEPKHLMGARALQKRVPRTAPNRFAPHPREAGTQAAEPATDPCDETTSSPYLAVESRNFARANAHEHNAESVCSRTVTAATEDAHAFASVYPCPLSTGTHTRPWGRLRRRWPDQVTAPSASAPFHFSAVSRRLRSCWSRVPCGTHSTRDAIPSTSAAITQKSGGSFVAYWTTRFLS